MKLDNIELHNQLLSKGVSHFFHANTVATSISFILAGGLMSRGDIERRSIFQTPQTSDSDDKRFDVWDDVFLDAEDLHTKFRRQNKYGPIMFQVSINFLISNDLDVWVTRDNPIRWTDELNSEERYFQNVSELMLAWGSPSSQKRMITIRKPGSPVLFPFVDAIVYDYFDGSVFSDLGLHAGEVTEHSLFAATESFRSLRSRVSRRDCKGNCFCAENYAKEISDLERARFFCPKDLIHSGRAK